MRGIKSPTLLQGDVEEGQCVGSDLRAKSYIENTHIEDDATTHVDAVIGHLLSECVNVDKRKSTIQPNHLFQVIKNYLMYPNKLPMHYNVFCIIIIQTGI